MYKLLVVTIIAINSCRNEESSTSQYKEARAVTAPPQDIPEEQDPTLYANFSYANSLFVLKNEKKLNAQGMIEHIEKHDLTDVLVRPGKFFNPDKKNSELELFLKYCRENSIKVKVLPHTGYGIQTDEVDFNRLDELTETQE